MPSPIIMVENIWKLIIIDLSPKLWTEGPQWGIVNLIYLYISGCLSSCLSINWVFRVAFWCSFPCTVEYKWTEVIYILMIFLIKDREIECKYINIFIYKYIFIHLFIFAICMVLHSPFWAWINASRRWTPTLENKHFQFESQALWCIYSACYSMGI